MNTININHSEKITETKNTYTDYVTSKYYIITKVAYLAGVKKNIFENSFEPPKIEGYEELEKNVPARIIRNLCMLRTSIEVNYQKINSLMYHDNKSLSTLGDLIPQECLNELREADIILEHTKYTLNQTIIDINKHICNRINNCKDLFPLWLSWEYVKKLFIMPNGLKEEGIKIAANEFYSNKKRYPYQVYINWTYMDSGNIFYNDEKFVTLLYKANGDNFTDISKVRDAGNIAIDRICRFMNENEKICLVVDCENSDPFKLCAVLKSMTEMRVDENISKILLFDDIHTTSAWGILEKHTNIPVEHLSIERVKENKSLVDISLASGVCREHYQNCIDAFVLFSSDSDYWGLIKAVPNASFLVMVEHTKCGPDIKNALNNAGIMFCYIDDFCTVDSNGYKINTILQEFKHSIQKAIKINVYDLFIETCRTTRADMTQTEANQFYNKYIKTMALNIAESGEMEIVIGTK